MIRLRDYQTKLLEQVRQSLEPDRARVMLQLPTGGGKTVIAAHLLADYLIGRRQALWITHRTELAGQTLRMLREAADVRAYYLEQPPRAPIQAFADSVVILMAQTAGRRAQNSDVWYRYSTDDLMIVDEAHHSSASGYERAMGRWQGRVLGMTATPWRLSEKEGFDHLFGELICGPQVPELQAVNSLCEGRVLVPDPDERILGGEIGSIGDYTEGGIERANEGHPDIMTAGVLMFWQEHGRIAQETRGRQTIVYAISVRHARNLVRVFENTGVSAGLMLGDTPLDERAATIENFRNGNINVLVNVAVATEGFDLPDASCVVIARPTESLSLYLQMVGRGLRPKDDGGDCVILDLAGNTLRHGLPEEYRHWSLAPRGSKSQGEAPVVWCESCRTISPAASHSCRRCGAPFGKDCLRCGKWRAWKRWGLETICGNIHDPVCDLCHKDAHVQAHLPVTDQIEQLAGQEEEESEVMVDQNDLDQELALLIRKLLNDERDSAYAKAGAKKDELRAIIAGEDRDLRDDAVLNGQFETYLEAVPLEQRPKNFPQKASLFIEWKGERRRLFAARRDELAEVESQLFAWDGSEVFAKARDRLLRILSREAETVDLSTGEVASDRSPRPHGTVEAIKTDVGDQRRRHRRSSGELLPSGSYTCPILVTVLRMGGEGRTRDVIERVGAILSGQLRPGDLELNRNGTQIVWQNRMQWNYQKLKNDGLFDPEAPMGIWRLTQTGREQARRCEQDLQ